MVFFPSLLVHVYVVLAVLVMANAASAAVTNAVFMVWPCRMVFSEF